MPIELGLVSESLQQNDKVSAAWVFGSVATGKDRPDSDIDIAVLFIKADNMFVLI